MIPRKVLFATYLFAITPLAHAGEGMWLPLLLEQYNIEDMQRKGLRLTAEEIYSASRTSIKDAVVMFGGRCTGSIISPKGLVITNHHCGYAEIQAHSSVGRDFLRDGFWARSLQEELVNPELAVTLLVSMEDVTQRVLRGTEGAPDQLSRDAVVLANINAISDSATANTHYTARVLPFFFGNQYFLFVYETFTDVRLVGTPPTSIGKFGGDTDNWMWPRHSGDFMYFRIYANRDNKPAPYSPDNVPYQPKHFLPISAGGVEPGDFTMVYGYPASTEQFLTSHAVRHLVEDSNPLKINIRSIRLDAMDKYMADNDTVRIKYASKHARVSNAWKKWKGERSGLIRLRAVERKQEQEAEFGHWYSSSPELTKKYGYLLPRFTEVYAQLNPISMLNDLNREGIHGVELLSFASRFQTLINTALRASADSIHTAELARNAEAMVATTRLFFRNYHEPIDRMVLGGILKIIMEKTPADHIPPSLVALVEGAEGNWELASSNLFNATIFTDSTRIISLLNGINGEAARQLQRDVVFRIASQADSIFGTRVSTPMQSLNDELRNLYKTYVLGLMKMQPGKVFYPDANFTLRVSYGMVNGYSPSDGITYLHSTSSEGITQKARKGIPDYEAPKRLLELFQSKAFGEWQQDGTLPVNFLASNHTSGGNSGSPIINANGHFIGINFDRVWEGTMSDIMFDPDRCRNISVDTRYILFITKNFANAGYLLDEMHITH